MTRQQARADRLEANSRDMINITLVFLFALQPCKPQRLENSKYETTKEIISSKFCKKDFVHWRGERQARSVRDRQISTRKEKVLVRKIAKTLISFYSGK